MPSRIVREGILTSLAVDQLTSGAELFYRRMLNVVDDFGRYHGTPALLRAAAFPLKIDKVANHHIEAWIGECVKAGLMTHYTVDGLPYVEIQKFGPPRAKESKFPPQHTDENKCKQTRADESNGTVVVVESVVVDEVETTLPDKSGAKPRKAKTYPADFEEWWNLYPRLIRDGKGKAAKVWSRMAAADRRAAMDAVSVFAGIVNKAPPDRQTGFKRPEAWLNADSWNTDPDVWRAHAKPFGGKTSARSYSAADEDAKLYEGL